MSRYRILWFFACLLLLAACITLGITLGWGATAVLATAAVAPDVSLVGAFANEGRLKPHRVKFYNLLHAAALPAWLAVIGCIVAALTQEFTALLVSLAWFAHIAADRACGYRLRASDGSIQPERAREAATL